MKCHLRCHLSESFTSLPIWITLFPFLLWSPCLGLQKLCHIIVGRVGTLVLFLILEEMLSLFTIENSVCCGFVIYSLYYVEVCFFYAYFLESFYHQRVLKSVKCFLWIFWDDHMVFIFQFVDRVYSTDWRAYIEKCLHPWDKPP